MPSQIPEGFVAIQFSLPQEVVKQLDLYLAEERIKQLQATESAPALSRASWVRSIIERHIEKLNKK